MAKLDTKQNFSIPTSESERDKIILLAVKVLSETVGGNITLNQLLSYVDNNLNSLKSDLVAKENMLSYEEIMASTPPLNLEVAIPKASAVKELGEVKTYEVTDVNGGTSRIYKYGKICVLNKMFVGIFGTGNSWRKILTVPDECLPKEEVAFPVVMFNPTVVAYGLIYTNGSLSVYPTNFENINANTQYHLLAVWATN